VLLIVGPVGLGGLVEQLGDLGLEVGVGAVGRGGGVGLDLGAVQGDQSQAHHPRRTIPAAAHSFNDWTSRPARACSWRTRKRAMVT
jgi:hypothetical protein